MEGGVQSGRSHARHDPATQTVNGRSLKPKPDQTAAKKKDHHGGPNKPTVPAPAPRQQQKKPLLAANSLKPPAEPEPDDLRDGEKVYAGAKFSEPPSPSVLPKPPSHWVGGEGRSREQMSVHLKSLLKVQDSSS